jgi:FAD/FMN-containing dehydrogenase
MRGLKKLAHPNGIMNPGKVFGAVKRDAPEKSY